MFNPRIIIALCLLSAFVMAAQPTKPPKVFPKFASQTRGASLTPTKKQKSQQLDLAPQTVESNETQVAVEENKQAEKAAVSEDKIEWLTFEEALEKQKKEPRKLYLDVYTDWCGWCKHMDKETFTDADVIKTINEQYYAVKFDAEQKEDIVFKEKTYKFVNSGRRGYHELAQFFLNGRMGYPTSVFLDENLNVIQPIPGYLDAQKLDMILQYFGTDSYQNIPWETYQKQYKAKKGIVDEPVEELTEKGKPEKGH